MSPQQGSTSDTFMIAGLLFRDTPGEPTRWTAGRVAAVAPVDVVIAPGVSVTVDVARPAIILEFTIEPFGDVEALVSACAPSSSIADIVESLREGNRAPVADLRLREPWIRKALVDGVKRWLVHPIDEGALLLDQAAASQAAGDPAAAGLVALGAPVLESLSMESRSGSLPTPIAVALSDAAGLAAAAVADLAWGQEIADQARQLARDAGLSELMIDIDRWMADTTSPLMLKMSGALVAGATEVRQYLVDPLVTKPRILKWFNASHTELRVVVSEAGDEQIAEVRVQLSDTVDELCGEVADVSIFAADPVNGVLLRTTSTELDGRALRATMRHRPSDSGVVVYGVFDADQGVAALRFHRLDKRLIEIDRLMLAAWSRYRQALTVQVLAGAQMGADRVQDLLHEAQDLVADARATLDIQRVVAGPDPARTAVTAARASAIEEYEQDLQSSVAEPGCGPLLAELLVQAVTDLHETR